MAHLNKHLILPHSGAEKQIKSDPGSVSADRMDLEQPLSLYNSRHLQGILQLMEVT